MGFFFERVLEEILVPLGIMTHYSSFLLLLVEEVAGEEVEIVEVRLGIGEEDGAWLWSLLDDLG